MRIRVSIVEDDSLTRAGLREMLSQNPRFECLGDYASAEEALKKLPGNMPDVVLMDIELPHKSGVECTQALKVAFPDVQILMLTTYHDSEVIFNALRAGANGYLLKRTRPAALLKAIEEVYAGGAPMTASIARQVVTHFHQITKPTNEVDKLTPREREVLEELAKGSLYKEVADHLKISLSTVNSHIEAIYNKLHVQTRTEAVLKLRPQ